MFKITSLNLKAKAATWAALTMPMHCEVLEGSKDKPDNIKLLLGTEDAIAARPVLIVAINATDIAT